MRADFHWGFTLMVDRMDRQFEVLSKVAGHLDAIHKTLQSPLMTQARELFHLGQERFRKGLWDKALEAFLEAEKKNDVDFLLQLQTGKLLLYGRNESNNVVNLTEAERHLLLAARFAQAEKDSLPEWKTFCGQAHFHAAVAEYLIGEQRYKEGQTQATKQYLRNALEHLTMAVGLWPEFTETLNLQAKCHSLLGERQSALAKLQILSDRDRRYYAKAKQDQDFRRLLPDIEAIFRGALTQPGPRAQATQKKLEGACAALALARRPGPIASWALKFLGQYDVYLAGAKQILPTVDVDIEEVDARLTHIRYCIDEITANTVATQKMLDDAFASLARAKSGRSTSAPDVKTLEEIEGYLTRAKQAPPTVGVDFDDLKVQLPRMRQTLDQMAARITADTVATQKMLDAAFATLDWARRSRPTSAPEVKTIDQIEGYLTRAKQALPTVGVDFDDLKVQLPRMRQTLHEMAARTFASHKDSLEAEIKSAEESKIHSQRAIPEMEKQMKELKGTGMGWLFAFLFFIVLALGLPIIMVPWRQEIKSIPWMNTPFFALLVIGVWVTVGYQVGKCIAVSRKKQPLIANVTEHRHAIEECTRRVPVLKLQLEKLNQEAREFAAWQNGAAA
jgi:tetratricopeptide (TPR) repeat protein